MCKSKVDLPKPAKQSSTNVGLLNLSENTTGVGIAEVLMMVILLILIFFVFKWCCKSYRRNNERRERNLQEMIQRVESRPTASAPAQPPSTCEVNPGCIFRKTRGQSGLHEIKQLGMGQIQIGTLGQSAAKNESG